MKTPNTDSRELDKALKHLVIRQNRMYGRLDKKEIAQIIEICLAYTANKQLEARIDELRRLLLTTACSRLGCTTNHQLKYNTVQKRIAELKALDGTN